MTFPVGTKREGPLLKALWEQRSQSGWWLVEVPLGIPGAEAAPSDRRLDALVLPEAPDRVSDQDQHLHELSSAVESQPVELIEAKASLDVDVIGQLLCGAAMFTGKYPRHGPMTLTALVGTADDAALKWCCDLENIEVLPLGKVWRQD